MKKKLIVLLSLFSLLFMFGGDIYAANDDNVVISLTQEDIERRNEESRCTDPDNCGGIPAEDIPELLGLLAWKLSCCLCPVFLLVGGVGGAFYIMRSKRKNDIAKVAT